MNEIPKFIASRSRNEALEWNATAIEGDAIDGVRRLKAEHRGDLVMSGCGELARELIQAGLMTAAFLDPSADPGQWNSAIPSATIPVRLLEARPSSRA